MLLVGGMGQSGAVKRTVRAFDLPVFGGHRELETVPAHLFKQALVPRATPAVGVVGQVVF